MEVSPAMIGSARRQSSRLHVSTSLSCAYIIITTTTTTIIIFVRSGVALCFPFFPLVCASE